MLLQFNTYLDDNQMHLRLTKEQRHFIFVTRKCSLYSTSLVNQLTLGRMIICFKIVIYHRKLKI